MEMTDWHPVPADLNVVYARVPGGAPRFLYGVRVGYGGTNGRTPMVAGRNGRWEEHTIPLALVWRYDDRMRLLGVLLAALEEE
jgi:hypothetical protein